MGIFDKGVKKTNRSFFDRLSRAIVGRTEVDDDVLDAIEEALLATDMGVDTAMKVIENLEERVREDKYVSMNDLVDMLRNEIAGLLNVSGEDASDDAVAPFDFSHKPYVIMVVGVNGVGKTTTIGKLASSLKAQGKKVVPGFYRELSGGLESIVHGSGHIGGNRGFQSLGQFQKNLAERAADLPCCGGAKLR